MATQTSTAGVYCYCLQCIPRKLWTRRTVLDHLRTHNLLIQYPQGSTERFLEKLKACSRRTADSLAGHPPELGGSKFQCVRTTGANTIVIGRFLRGW